MELGGATMSAGFPHQKTSSYLTSLYPNGYGDSNESKTSSYLNGHSQKYQETPLNYPRPTTKKFYPTQQPFYNHHEPNDYPSIVNNKDFLHNYNAQNTTNNVEYYDNNGRPQGWDYTGNHQPTREYDYPRNKSLRKFS